MTSAISAPEAVGTQASEGIRLRGGMIPLNQRKMYSDAELTAKSEEFESLFISQMLGHMFEGVGTNETFGGGEGEDAFKSFMTDEYSKMIVKTGGIGIADNVKAEMIRMQETSTGNNPLRAAAVNP